MSALWIWFLEFALGFIVTLGITYNVKRKFKKGEIDWQACTQYQRARPKFILLMVLGAVITPIGLYAIAKRVFVIETFLGIKVNIILDVIVTVGIVALGPVLVGMGLGFVLGSLIFPIKNPTTD